MKYHFSLFSSQCKSSLLFFNNYHKVRYDLFLIYENTNIYESNKEKKITVNVQSTFEKINKHEQNFLWLIRQMKKLNSWSQINYTQLCQHNGSNR